MNIQGLFISIFLVVSVAGSAQQKKYIVICSKETLKMNSQGATLSPLEVVSIDRKGLSQINKYNFDTRHRAYKEFKQRLIPRDSFSISINKYLIDTATLYKWERENEVLIFLKKKADGTCIIIPDINHNGKFSDDSVYNIKDPVKDELIIPYQMNFWYRKKYTKKFDIVLLPDPSHVPKRYTNAVFNTWGGTKKIMKGKLYVGLDSFLIYIYLPGNSIYFTKHNSRISLSAPNENYIDIYQPAYPIYSMSDTIYAGNKMLMLDTVSILGDTVVFKTVGDNEEMKGVQKGAVIKNLGGKIFLTENYREINLQRTDSWYTLLHFWGSWCAPCIENLPKISQLYENYNDKVEVISFPYDLKKDFSKTKSLIQKYSMNWIQIVQPRDDPFQKADVVNQLKIDAFPTYILLDSNGKILLRTSDISEIEKYVK